MTFNNNPKKILVEKFHPKFTELKGIAILLILIYHSGGVLGINNYLHGEIGVDIFLLISGSLLTLNYYTKNNLSYFFVAKRLIKIIPLYWLILTAVIIFKKYLLSIKYDNIDILFHFLGMQAFNKNYFLSINDSFWFISAILLCYFLFIFIFKYLKKEQENLIFYGFGLAIILQIIALLTSFSVFLIHFSTRIISFTLGILIMLAIKKKLEIKLNSKIIVVFLIQSYIVL